MSKKHHKLFFIFLIGLMTMAAADLTSTQSDVRPTMGQFAQEVYGLRDYLTDEKRFLDPANEKAIASRISRLRNISERAGHTVSLQKPDYEQTVGFLERHLKKTEESFQQGHKELARYMLESTIHTCISCHARLPVDQLKFQPETPQLGRVPVTLEEGEFLFAIRDFQHALEVFQRLIMKYPKNNMDLADLLNALDYSANIYARVLRDPRKAFAAFEKISRQSKLPSFVQEDVNQWVRAFRAWSQEADFVLTDHTDAEVVAEAERILDKSLIQPLFTKDRSNRIAYLRASGLLHEFLIARPQTPKAPEAYYLLGICYLSLDQDFFTGFDQMYLKNCIRDYPRSPVAKKCYTLLEESIYLGFSGSSGIHVPFDVMQELNQYKKRIK